MHPVFLVNYVFQDLSAFGTFKKALNWSGGEEVPEHASDSLTPGESTELLEMRNKITWPK